MGKAIRESSIETRLGKKFQLGNVYSLIQKEVYSYLCMWTIFKLVGKKQNVNPTWKILMKGVDLGEPTSFLDHIHLGCTQRECQISKDMVDNYQKYVRIKDFCWGYGKIPV